MSLFPTVHIVWSLRCSNAFLSLQSFFNHHSNRGKTIWTFSEGKGNTYCVENANLTTKMSEISIDRGAVKTLPMLKFAHLHLKAPQQWFGLLLCYDMQCCCILYFTFTSIVTVVTIPTNQLHGFLNYTTAYGHCYY